jgi:2-polyprenyl-3-methyl-5-hydroxy-6-metoxy-1,4-benzoquinol methylase
VYYSFENYWKKIYQTRVNSNYKTQSIQSEEIIDWHKQYINNDLSVEFKTYKPRVLDIGCCSGYLTNLFCYFSSEVVGVDYEDGFIKDAKLKYSDPKFLKGDLYNLNKIEGKFDLIVCFGVLQNISDLKLALKNIKSKLSNQYNSKVIITTINQKSIFKKNKLAQKLINPKENNKFSIHVFSKEQFSHFAEQSGLELTKYDLMYVLPKFLKPFVSFAKLILPSWFSHHVLIEMKNARRI